MWPSVESEQTMQMVSRSRCHLSQLGRQPFKLEADAAKDKHRVTWLKVSRIVRHLQWLALPANAHCGWWMPWWVGLVKKEWWSRLRRRSRSSDGALRPRDLVLTRLCLRVKPEMCGSGSRRRLCRYPTNQRSENSVVHGRGTCSLTTMRSQMTTSASRSMAPRFSGATLGTILTSISCRTF